MLAAPLDVLVRQETPDYSLGCPNVDLSGAVAYLRDSPQGTSLGGLSSGICYQTVPVAQPAVAPLSPISPAWAVQHHLPPWPIADAKITIQCPPRTNLAAAAVVKDPTVVRPILTHSARLYCSINDAGYPSPPTHWSRDQNHDYHHKPPKESETYSSPGAATGSQTGLVSPPHSLIGPPESTTTFHRRSTGLLPTRDSRQTSGITASAYSQTQGPTGSTESPGPIHAGSRASGSWRNSTPTSPHSGIRNRRRSVRPHPQARKHSKKTARGNLNSTQQVVDSKKDKIHAYHREVGARNRQREKEERQRFELQCYWLEKVNCDLVLEEKSLAAEKMALVDELFRHSQCGYHGDIEEYLAVESSKIIQRAKARFLKE